MSKFSLAALLTLGFFAWQLPEAHAQQPAKTTYMQIFYEGSNWMAGQPILHYSPAFRGKKGELVIEDSTKVLSPGAFVFNTDASETSVTEGVTETTTNTQAFSKPSAQSIEAARKHRQAEAARLNRSLALLEARATLARTALSQALNAAAADGWEVIQMTGYGTQGGLVYLLKRR